MSSLERRRGVTAARLTILGMLVGSGTLGEDGVTAIGRGGRSVVLATSSRGYNRVVWTGRVVGGFASEG